MGLIQLLGVSIPLVFKIDSRYLKTRLNTIINLFERSL